MSERDHHDSSFYDFADSYGDKLATEMLEAACDCHYSRSNHSKSGNITVDIWSKENSSGDQLNYVLKGAVNDTRHFVEFEIEDGNYNGTVVYSWERVWKHTAHPLPKTSIWIYQPAAVIATKIIIGGQRHILDRMRIQIQGISFTPMPKADADLLARSDHDYLKIIAQKFLIPQGHGNAEISSRDDHQNPLRNP